MGLSHYAPAIASPIFTPLNWTAYPAEDIRWHRLAEFQICSRHRHKIQSEGLAESGVLQRNDRVTSKVAQENLREHAAH